MIIFNRNLIVAYLLILVPFIILIFIGLKNVPYYIKASYIFFMNISFSFISFYELKKDIYTKSNRNVILYLSISLSLICFIVLYYKILFL